ncbi:MAG: MBL fold metallo-hydrolase [Erythrobacter sp.]
MDIRVFRAGKGDAVLLTSSEGKTILVDGGVPAAYREHWADFAAEMREEETPIDLVCVSHTDRDHIGGILAMMTNEVKWRVHDFRSRSSARTLKPPKIKRPPEVRAIWHNAFLEKVRQRRLRSSDHGEAALDMADILFRTSMVHAGAGSAIL